MNRRATNLGASFRSAMKKLRRGFELDDAPSGIRVRHLAPRTRISDAVGKISERRLLGLV